MWFINVVVLVCLVEQSLCCSCAPGHIQDAFCRDGIMIQGKATRRYYTDDVDADKGNNPHNPDIIEIVTLPNPWNRRKLYDVEVMEIFKAPANSNIKAGDVIQAVTRADGGMCGGWFKLHEELLMTGGLDNQGRLKFGLCSYKKTFSALTKFQLEGIRGSYDCDCKVDPVWFRDRDDKNTCEMGYDYECLDKFGRCVKGKTQGCKWDVSDDSCSNHPTTVPN